MDERMEAAWQAQETARLGTGGDTADLLVAQALSHPPPMDLPADFAARVAQQAEAAAQGASAVFEWTLAAVAAALLLLAAAVALSFNPGWTTSLQTPWDLDGPAGWALWAAVALLASACSPALFPYPLFPSRKQA